jgi:hypothetical protein
MLLCGRVNYMVIAIIIAIAYVTILSAIIGADLILDL